MARTYSPALQEAVNYRGPYNLGRELGKVCIEANIPATYVAFMLSTTRPTIHAWFRGGVIRDSKKHMIEVLIRLMEKDLKAGDFRLLSRRAREAMLEMGETHRLLRGMSSWIAAATSYSTSI